MKNYKELKKDDLKEINGGSPWLILAAIALLAGVVWGMIENPDIVE